MTSESQLFGAEGGAPLDDNAHSVLGRALILAQRAADETIAEARAEADRIVAQARAEARAIVAQARERAGSPSPAAPPRVAMVAPVLPPALPASQAPTMAAPVMDVASRPLDGPASAPSNGNGAITATLAPPVTTPPATEVIAPVAPARPANPQLRAVLSSIPVEAVLPLVALLILLIVVLAWMG